MKKRTISIILWFVVSIMLIAIFSSCEGIGEDNPVLDSSKYPLTLEELNAINQAWSGGNFADNVEDVGWLDGGTCVYAKYGDCIVIGVSNGMTNEYSECTVSGYLFKYSRNTIHVYYNGEIYKLPEAYENELLTDAQIKELWELHNACILKNEDYLVTETELVAINQLWGEKPFAEHIADIESLGGAGAFLYGRFGSCIVLGKFGETDDMSEYTVADKEFMFSNSVLKVYKDNKLYSLPEAYKDELLTDENIEKIYELHCTRILRSSSVITSKWLDRINRLWGGMQFADTVEDVAFRQKANSFVYAFYNSEEIIVLGKTSAVAGDSEFTVAGYTFRLLDMIIKVDCDGELCSLEEAYSRGLLTENQIRELYELHTSLALTE
ncbi:MAG: hypothetical protein J6S71_08375 [Clostridia bacterium]|nr:hypothetical protein [Clostridia bacterium]